MNNIVTARKQWMGLALVLIVALAAGFRLYHLGVSAFRADTMVFYDNCRNFPNAWLIVVHWVDQLGQLGQLPFPLAFTKGFIDLLHLAPTAFAVRLPSALFGILTVLAMYAVGRQAAGRLFGVLAALWMAVNPFHIQLSREAYFYAPLLLGVALQTWACLWAWRHRRRIAPFPIRFHLLAHGGFFLTIYSHFAGWCMGAVFAAFLAWILGRRAWRNPRARREFWWWLALSAVLGAPLLFVPWGVRYFLSVALSPDELERSRNIMGGLQIPLIKFVWESIQSAAWGRTPLRAVALAVGGGLVVGELAFKWTRCRRAWLLGLFLLGGFLSYKLTFVTAGSYYAQRHMSYLLPLYLGLLAYGVWHVSLFPGMRRVIKSPFRRRLPAYILAGAALALSLAPAWYSTQLTGKPIPYKDITRWCDTQLPPRTLVLVERWLDPWNELRVHNSTNVVFTFTVPAEPADVFKQMNWPATAKAFFNNFPDAAYLEYHGSARNEKGVVTNVYFARRVVFTNAAAIRLAKFGAAYRDEFYDPATNGIVSTIFYNTRADVIRHAREQGQTALVLYAPSWGYVKLWQQLVLTMPDGRQTRDWRDWRILEGQAELEIYNLTDRTNQVSVLIRGMAVNGSKRVRFGMFGQADFQSMQLAEWRVERVPLAPGLNRFSLTDTLWSVSKIPLLVDRVAVAEDRRPAADAVSAE